MAIILKLDEQQVDRIVDAVNALSDNLAKWQGEQAGAIERGFVDLIATLGGTDNDDLQEAINRIATSLNLDADQIHAALNQPKTVEGE